jgi:hypothetical protein
MSLVRFRQEAQKFFNKKQHNYQNNSLYLYKLKNMNKMTENEHRFERKLRIGFGLIIVGFVIWIMSSCSTSKHVDCDAYGQTTTQQVEKTI